MPRAAITTGAAAALPTERNTLSLNTNDALARAHALVMVAAAIPERRSHARWEPTKAERDNEKRRNALIWDSRLFFEDARYVRPGLLEADQPARYIAALTWSTTFELELLCADLDAAVSGAAQRTLRLVRRSIERERTRRRECEKRALDRERRRASDTNSPNTGNPTKKGQ